MSSNSIKSGLPTVAFRAMGVPSVASFGSGDAAIFSSLGTYGFDTAGGYSTVTGLYTVPVSGVYRVSAQLVITATYSIGQAAAIYLMVNGSANVFAGDVDFAAGSTGVLSVNASALIYLNLGDTVQVNPESTGSGPNFDVNPYRNWFELERIGD